MHLGFYGGAENGVKDNIKSRIEVPSWEKAIPFMIGEIPMALHLKFKFLVETAFSGGDSSMWAGGDYQLDGPVGIENGAFVSPNIVVVKPMSENMHGLTVGVAGLIVATEFRFLLGFGNRAFITGLYSKTIITFGTVKGSFLAFGLGGPLSSPFGALAKCRGIKLKGDTGGGVGIYFDKTVAPDFIIAKVTELELFENMGTFFNKEYRFGCPTADK